MTGQFAALAVGASRVLIVEAPGAWRTRVAIEREVARRGWRLALSAADADALVVAGAVGAELSQRIECVWQQLPGPRARTAVPEGPDWSHEARIRAIFDGVQVDLLDTDRQVADARERVGFDPESLSDDTGEDDMDMEDGGEMDMDMDMSPSGIPLAEGGQDRDGLEMDELHVSLGPVLPFWPPGLVLRCTLQGDVVVAADAEILDAAGDLTSRLDGNERAARRCDQVAGVLALAGWADGYAAAVRARNTLMSAPDATAATRLLEGLDRQIRRRRLLRWSLRGIGDLRGVEDVQGTPRTDQGDVYDRLLFLIQCARSDATGGEPSTTPLEEILPVAERLVVGLDLAAMRLVIASLAIDTSAAAPRRAEPQGVLYD